MGFTASQIVVGVALSFASVVWLTSVIRRDDDVIDPFKALGIGSLVGLVVEGAWQSVAFLRLGELENHNVGALWPNAKPLATDWQGVLMVAEYVGNAPVAFLLALPLVTLFD